MSTFLNRLPFATALVGAMVRFASPTSKIALVIKIVAVMAFEWYPVKLKAQCIP